MPDLGQAIRGINDNSNGNCNGIGIFTRSGAFARQFQREVKVGMVGVNIPIPVPVAWHDLGGWDDALFGVLHVNGPDGVRLPRVTSW